MSADDDRDAEGRDRWAEALTWYDAIRTADSKHAALAIMRDWRDWYAQPENRRIFDSLDGLMADRNRYGQPRRPEKAELDEDHYDLSMPIAQWRRRQPPRHPRPAPPRRWWWWLSGGVGFAAIAVLFVSLPLGLGGRNGAAAAAIYQTGIGGFKKVCLRDGSSIVLGGRTRLTVAFSPQRRSVRLLQGEAWFKVAHDRTWPFVVAAGDGTITAIGTAFLVTRESDRVVVTVTEGTVEVSEQPRVWPPLRLIQRFTWSPIPPPIAVRRGEELALSEDGAVPLVRRTDTHAATAWTHGRLIFDDQPLRYVVQTVNRYSSRRIVVDPSVGDLRFSGIVFDDDIEDWLKSLEVIFPVTEKERDTSIYIRMRISTAISPNAPQRHHS